MIIKYFNDDNLNSKEIDEVVTRVKAIIINSSNEILLGYSHKTYQFPGGHLENEDLNAGLERELKEELGVDTKVIEKPFMKVIEYSRNYRNTGKNRENDIYYFIINEDIKPDMANANLDENEIKGNYIPMYIPLNDVENILICSIPDNPINKIIVSEMLEVLKNIKSML